MEILDLLKTCDHKSAVRLLSSELIQKSNKKELARLLHPDKHPGDPFFEFAMKALNCAVDLLEEKHQSNVTRNEENRREAERVYAYNNRQHFNPL
jgi:hypothetical protein